MHIQQLPLEVVNRIAAGEVIVRPANALKELIENSLDAGSSKIDITLRSGGVKLLQISDDGHGIANDDMEIVCERFTTSKIRCYDDLRTVATFGFRGEALASISHVAHLSITTRTEDAACGYTCEYLDGIPIGPAKPAPRTPGTTIQYEDLFYNVPTRIRGLSSTAEEHLRVLEVVQKYALHNPHVAFSCKKSGAARPDFRTLPRESDASARQTTRSLEETKQVVKIAHGTSVADAVIDVDCIMSVPEQVICRGLISNPNTSFKKETFVLFINERLVESSAIRRAVMMPYTDLLPKGQKAWAYLSMTFPPEMLDVNVHPTKKEVQFLRSDRVTSELFGSIRGILESHSQSRVFTAPPPGTAIPLSRALTTPEVKEPAEKKKQIPTPTRIRVDPTQTSLSFMSQKESPALSQPLSDPSPQLESAQLQNESPALSQPQKESPALSQPLSDPSPHLESAPPTLGISGGSPLLEARVLQSESDALSLDSVQELLIAIERRRSAEATNLAVAAIWVGAVNRKSIVVQSGSNLVLLRIDTLAQEAIYQSILRRIGRLPEFCFSPAPLPLKSIIDIGLKREEDNEAGNNRGELLLETIASSAPMLSDYFSIHLTDDGCSLSRFPRCVGPHFPDASELPICMRNIGDAILTHKSQEKLCLDAIARCIATFFAQTSPTPYPLDDNAESQLRLSLFPAVSQNGELALPSRFLEDGSIRVLTDLNRMYRVFERC